MFLYAASAPAYLPLVKLGYTHNCRKRLQTYLTGCPPGLSPSVDLQFYSVWEVFADDIESLREYEEDLHCHFEFAVTRRNGKKTEWFNIPGADPIQTVHQWIISNGWFKRRVPPGEYFISQHEDVAIHCPRNTRFVRSDHRRTEVLDNIQLSVIQRIHTFIFNSPSVPAAYVIAPCGSGKTVMTCKGMRGISRCIICCPSQQIQTQWYDTLRKYGVFESNIIRVREGNTDLSKLRHQIDKTHNTFCIISTYMSSDILIQLGGELKLQLVVLDEAHHMAGRIDPGSGIGKTRRFLEHVRNMGIKRLSLTYTPRIYTSEDGTTSSVIFSMDDATIFGERICELKIRDLISVGVLPDYCMWGLYDAMGYGIGLLAKAQYLIDTLKRHRVTMIHEARKIEVSRFHHLLIFAHTNDDATTLERMFHENCPDFTVICLQSSGNTNITTALRDFDTAAQSILISCKMLGEGVDIPHANAVAVMYPKHSKVDTIQMLLRPGRWHHGKSRFHILLPTTSKDDTDNIRVVLQHLAQCDPALEDNIYWMMSPSGFSHSSNNVVSSSSLGTAPGHTQIFCIESTDTAGIQRFFGCVCETLYPITRDNIRLQCQKLRIDTSTDYANIRRNSLPLWPENPTAQNETWYDFLHPQHPVKITRHEFVTNVPNMSSTQYDDWRCIYAPHYPSLPHINDGYFSVCDNFENLWVAPRRR